MTVIVCGGRGYADGRAVFKSMEKLPRGTRIVTGGCITGADYLAGMAARLLSLPVVDYPANWELGKSAGPIRNQRMLDLEKPDLVIAFPGGKGTADMVRRSLRAGVRVMDWRGHEVIAPKTVE